MTATTDTRIPQASLREEWAVASVQRWARAMGRPATAVLEGSTPSAAVPVDPVRAARRASALLRLASDTRAPAHERALAADRAADLLRRSA